MTVWIKGKKWQSKLHCSFALLDTTGHSQEVPWHQTDAEYLLLGRCLHQDVQRGQETGRRVLSSRQYEDGGALQCLPTPSPTCHIWPLSAWGQNVLHYYWVPLDGKCMHFSLWTYSEWTTIKGSYACLLQGEGVPKKIGHAHYELKITALSDGLGAAVLHRCWPSIDLISRLY